jgi:uncharacterized protein (TIGR03085 family)
LCDLLDDVGPHAPTLCDSWDTSRLAAHLFLRESSSLELLRTVFSTWAAPVLDEVVRDHDFTEMVTCLREGPSPLSVLAVPQVDRVASALEFFVHHEDVRRATLGWTVRDLPAHTQDEIWSRLRWTAKVLMRRSPVSATLTRTDTDDAVSAAKGPDTVVIRGLPSELALFAFGRKEVARIEVDGSTSAINAIRGAHLGV